jgi:hypothetical protein
MVELSHLRDVLSYQALLLIGVWADAYPTRYASPAASTALQRGMQPHSKLHLDLHAH